MNTIQAKVAILATHGFEQAELEVPRDRLKAAGVTVHVVAPERGDILGWDHKDWGHPVPIDRTLDQVRPDDYDAVVLPGGQINPDLLRIQPAANWEDSEVVVDRNVITSRNPGDLEAFSKKIIEALAARHGTRSAA